MIYITKYESISLFIPKTFLQQKMYCTSDYQDRVLNVSKIFSSIEPNKLHGETILGKYKLYILVTTNYFYIDSNF